ncbi:hypothetical protein ISF_04666 [Cordyceps fumosorosea ARSEF 2679]|uniref:Mg2+ transporter protein, CorA-like/Zinc transport protein ZntB n=1 Tax=Cordyceps fumosorosea (strain ARSEF 2679) TaxID=1081104 RepID=A0A167WM01_CORFA|nr:hypothetical protein ISF_04666 [Cordyceps fumosorosea ARSEF 2679]OAA63957.1 hypothetical protein ISF_04666 [Cordyceps fumosorosea ARSEF 2679]
MRDLFFARRRMSHYCALIRQSAASAGLRGRPVWCTPHNSTEAQAVATRQVAADLQTDLAALEHRMTQAHARLQATMAHLTAETTNKILLVLAVIGTVFLPVSSLAAVFSMGGSWAASERNFAWFWAICGPVEVVLLGLLLGVSYWDIPVHDGNSKSVSFSPVVA